MKKRLTRCLQQAVLIGILLGMSASAWGGIPVTTGPYYLLQQSAKLITQLNQMKQQRQALNASQVDHLSPLNRGGNHVN